MKDLANPVFVHAINTAKLQEVHRKLLQNHTIEFYYKLLPRVFVRFKMRHTF